jgi:hypothetical protein
VPDKKHSAKLLALDKGPDSGSVSLFSLVFYYTIRYPMKPSYDGSCLIGTVNAKIKPVSFVSC